MTDREPKRRATARRRAHVALLSLLLAAGAVGCELALDFDRTKIDGGALDASFGDTNVPDQATPPGDGTTDTGTDGGADTGSDTGSDTGTDTGTDTGSDTGSDAGQDAADAADADDSG